MLWNGRIAGVSGILGGLLPPKIGDVFWRVAFVAGLMASPLVYSLFTPRPIIQIDSSLPVLVLAGLLVGIGTRYGAGCTSGHGVCGLARLSPRSLVATLSFMLSGFITVWLVRHLLA
ncbi:YeeE/YedE family protein [Yersinia aldovae ATCC 35236]|nr:YeeE/YedE family protein [Yersinia aldovae ATCC 35236]